VRAALDGGYIVLGVDAPGGVASLPPVGLAAEQIETIQRRIREWCNRIDPVYHPVIAPEIVDGRHILVVWAPGSKERPHRAPDSLGKANYHYYIRIGDSTVKAEDKQEHLTALMQLTASTPFDDRRALQASLDDLRESLTREYLRDVHSKLATEPDPHRIYRSLRVSERVNGHEVPRNVGLMFFTEEPEQWFRGARIEVVQFARSVGGKDFQESVFRGPLHRQLRDCLSYLRNLTTAHVQKHDDRPEASGWTNYPYPAIEEALANAVYHRGYEGSVEPTKVHLYPDRMVITSYPGPMPGLELRHFEAGAAMPAVPARNRRIGEILKELGLAEMRSTGVPEIQESMRDNGSPAPRFEFDAGRTYFQVTLPAHPDYAAMLTLRDAAQLRAIGDVQAALARLEQAFQARPDSGTIAAALIEAYVQQEGRYERRDRDLSRAQAAYEQFMAQPRRSHPERVVLALASALIENGRRDEAGRLLEQLSETMPKQDAIEAAVLARRSGRNEEEAPRARAAALRRGAGASAPFLRVSAHSEAKGPRRPRGCLSLRTGSRAAPRRA
jgi:ATP-dependent DNA helicase RecG